MSWSDSDGPKSKYGDAHKNTRHSKKRFPWGGGRAGRQNEKMEAMGEVVERNEEAGEVADGESVDQHQVGVAWARSVWGKSDGNSVHRMIIGAGVVVGYLHPPSWRFSLDKSGWVQNNIGAQHFGRLMTFENLSYSTSQPLSEKFTKVITFQEEGTLTKRHSFDPNHSCILTLTALEIHILIISFI